MRLTKIYTRVGDRGQTLLASGAKIRKTAPRIEAYGSVDELNSFVGLLRDRLVEIGEAFGDIESSLRRVQNELFDLGGELATPTEHLDVSRQSVVREAEVKRLEEEMDIWNEMLPPLANFVLPGGHSANSLAHVARTVCRRAERHVVRLRDEESDVREVVGIYLNRLSDWFFVLSREISRRAQVEEVIWQQRRGET